MDIASIIDHTYLDPRCESGAVEKLCAEAAEFGFHSVCVNPCEIARAARLLAGTGVAVCSVADFPFGAGTWAAKAFECRDCIAEGAGEVDLVANTSELLQASGSPAARARLLCEMRGLVDSVRDSKPDAVLKLILECCRLTEKAIAVGSELAAAAGFDFAKTSTGFGTGGATLEAVRIMRAAAGPDIGIKAAGGIRSLDAALAMCAAGATRLGCSAGVSIVREAAVRAKAGGPARSGN